MANESRQRKERASGLNMLEIISLKHNRCKYLKIVLKHKSSIAAAMRAIRLRINSSLFCGVKKWI